MKVRQIVVLAFAWWVVTFQGQKVAGPFMVLDDCTEVAKIMHLKFPNVTDICRVF
jgi:hypothetical protein